MAEARLARTRAAYDGYAYQPPSKRPVATHCIRNVYTHDIWLTHVGAYRDCRLWPCTQWQTHQQHVPIGCIVTETPA